MYIYVKTWINWWWNWCNNLTLAARLRQIPILLIWRQTKHYHTNHLIYTLIFPTTPRRDSAIILSPPSPRWPAGVNARKVVGVNIIALAPLCVVCCSNSFLILSRSGSEELEHTFHVSASLSQSLVHTQSDFNLNKPIMTASWWRSVLC